MTTHAETWKIAAEPFGRAIVAVAGIVAVRVRQIYLAAKNRHDAAALASLDDRMLADIGLSRSDLREAFSEPLWRDPTALLVSRVHQRRSSRSNRAVVAPSIVPQVGTAATAARRAS